MCKRQPKSPTMQPRQADLRTRRERFLEHPSAPELSPHNLIIQVHLRRLVTTISAYSVDNIQQCIKAPQYPLTFLDRIDSPKKLDSQFDSNLYNDFTKTGVFNREQLDETFSATARLPFAPTQTTCYTFNPEFKGALRAFVYRWQNPVTGCWGQWMVDRQGRVWKMDDGRYGDDISRRLRPSRLGRTSGHDC